MCGIYGFVGKPTKKTSRAIKYLAILNEERGQDSTGLFITNGEQGEVFKKPVNATRFMGKYSVKKIVSNYSKADFLLIIGHTRLATHGIINEDNAHPFEIGNIVMAHNGVINNFEELQREYLTDYHVDSEIIGHLLNFIEPTELFSKTLEGCYAVPYQHCDTPRRLDIARHISPVSFYFLPENKGIYYSSESTHLQTAMNLAGIAGKLAVGGDNKIYTMDYSGDTPIFKKTKLKMPKPSFYRYYGGGLHTIDTLDKSNLPCPSFDGWRW